MDDVLFPVDLIFVHSTEIVAGLLENVAVGDTRTLSAGDQSRWLIVTNAGWAAEHGIVKETPVRFENLPR